MAYLQLANIKKEYNVSRTQTQTVLRDITAEFKQGELVALLGESGSGKSTLINILGGLDTNYTGSVILNGQFLKDLTERQMDDYRKKRVGMIFQSYNLISNMTVLDNVKIAMKMSGVDDGRQTDRAIKLLKVVKMDHAALKLPNQLSGGQKQRVAIARALANNPEIILADEPTGALDKDSARLVMLILKKIAESGKLVIVVTHSQKVADECSRVVSIADGVIAQDVKAAPVKGAKGRMRAPVRAGGISSKNTMALAWNNLWRSRRRSLLVAIAMAIGMAAVILILSISSGITDYVNNVLVSGDDAMRLEIEKSDGTEFSDSEISAVEKLNGVAYTSAAVVSRSNVYYTYGNVSGTLLTLSSDEGALPSAISGEAPSEGQLYINEALAKDICSYDDYAEVVLGQTVELNMGNGESLSLTVAGVYEDGSSYSAFPCAYAARSVLEELYATVGRTLPQNKLVVAVESASYLSAVGEDLQTLGYTVSGESASLSDILSYIDLGTMVLTAVGAISLVVSAIMIFIVLYISVIERTKEIGVLRAVGGSKGDIRRIFLSEAAFLGAISGVIAVALSLLAAIVVNACTASLGVNIVSYFYGVYYIVGLALSVILSVCAGVAPASYAASLDPVESLRRE